MNQEGDTLGAHKKNNEDDDDSSMHRWEDGNLVEEEEKTIRPGTTPNPAPAPHNSDDDDQRLIEVKETSFQDPTCPKKSYRLEKPPPSDGSIILWAHTYSANNAPAQPPVSPFEEKPPPQANKAHVVLNFKQEKEDSSSSFSFWLHLPSFLHNHDAAKERSQPIVLVLSAYAKTKWTVDGKVAKVIATGYKAPEVTFVRNNNNDDDDYDYDDEVELFYYHGPKGRFPGWDSYWPPNPESTISDLRHYKQALEDHLGGSVYSYDYCYSKVVS